MRHRILVVEDDPTLRLVLQDNLRSEGYDVEVAADGVAGVRNIQAITPDLIVLDLTLPDCDGFELLPVLRQSGQVPIIVLTARTQQAEKLKGLTLGADDYITKPFDLEELLARVRAVLRRARPSISRVRLGNVTVDFLNKHASAGNRTIPFTYREFELLSYLAEHRDMVVRRSELLRAVCLTSPAQSRVSGCGAAGTASGLCTFRSASSRRLHAMHRSVAIAVPSELLPATADDHRRAGRCVEDDEPIAVGVDNRFVRARRSVRQIHQGVVDGAIRVHEVGSGERHLRESGRAGGGRYPLRQIARYLLYAGSERRKGALGPASSRSRSESGA